MSEEVRVLQVVDLDRDDFGRPVGKARPGSLFQIVDTDGKASQDIADALV